MRFVESIISIYLPLNELQLREQSKTKNFWMKRKADAQRKENERRFDKEQKSQSGMAENDCLHQNNKGYFAYFCVAAVTVSVLFCIHFGLIPTQTVPPKKRTR